MILLLIILAAFLNAVMDLLENENFHQSVFRHWNQKFWYKRESWKHAKKIFGYKIDGWHIAKSCMIVTLITATVMYQPIFHPVIDIGIMGMYWNVTFNFSYENMKL